MSAAEEQTALHKPERWNRKTPDGTHRLLIVASVVASER